MTSLLLFLAVLCGLVTRAFTSVSWLCALFAVLSWALRSDKPYILINVTAVHIQVTGNRCNANFLWFGLASPEGFARVVPYLVPYMSWAWPDSQVSVDPGILGE